MTGKPHYFAIGLFVLIASALGIMGIVVFSSNALRAPKHFIETYIDESVQGVDVGTQFKFRGVHIGNIHEIKLTSEVYDTDRLYVMIRIAIDDGAIRSDPALLVAGIGEQADKGLRVKLVPQGITGLSYLEADFFEEELSEPLQVDWEPIHTYIPSTPSMMKVLTRSLERITAQVNSLDLIGIGNNVENITSNLNLSVEHIETVTRDAAAVSSDVMDNALLASAELPSAASNLTAMVADMRNLVHSSDNDVDQIMTNLRYITEETRELVRMIKRSPSMLLTEPPEPKLNR
jgi:ABC-type transporter Mla subunit MlaD